MNRGTSTAVRVLPPAIGLGECAVAATMVAIVGLFLFSPETLEAQGFAYMTAGGGLLAKFHPCTFIAIAAIAMRCATSRRPVAALWRLVTGDPGVVLLLAATAVAGFCAVAIDRTPTSPLIDTFVLPTLVFLLLRDLKPTVMRWLAILVATIMCANAILAMAEARGGWHLIHIDVPAGASADPMRGDATFDWRAQLANDPRATALIGHPLSNGLMTAAFILCLAAAGSNWIAPQIKVGIVLLQSVAIFAFGARTALALALVLGAWLCLLQVVEAITRGVRLDGRRLLLGTLLVVLVVGALALLAQAGFVDRTISRFTEDNGSATTRITMFNLFQPISWPDLLFGPNSDLVATWQRLEGLEFGIESSWVGLALVYGLAVTTMLAIGLLAFFWSVIRASGRGAAVVFLLYLILISGSASISGKTTTFAMIVAMVMIFLRKDERRVPLWTPRRATA